ncbi:hypothetical protein LUZ60_000516 [Juncus effusus]|nr:hypothetical protein LUZ60_000516 [Juncus effusus]
MEDEMDVYQYNTYWETKRFLDNEELNHSWGINEALFGCVNTRSPNETGVESSGQVNAAKAIANEKNRRMKMNDSICNLRSTVPNITKMDKASTIKDAINYIQELQEQERQLQAEIDEIRSKKASSHFLNNEYNCTSYSSFSPETWKFPRVELHELEVYEIGAGTYIISMTCTKKSGSMMSLCEVIESIDLRIITSNITTVSGSILYTLTVQTDGMSSLQLKGKIENNISLMNALRRSH